MNTKTGTVYVDGVDGQTMSIDQEKELKHQHPEIALDQLAASSDDVLFETKSVFPFDFWPDKLRIAVNQIEIVYKNDPISKYIYPMPIDKILTVRVHKGLFLAEIEIEIEGHEQDPSKIKFLRKSEAEEASQLIMGLKIAHTEEINLKDIPKEEMIERIKQVSFSHASS